MNNSNISIRHKFEFNGDKYILCFGDSNSRSSDEGLLSIPLHHHHPYGDWVYFGYFTRVCFLRVRKIEIMAGFLYSLHTLNLLPRSTLHPPVRKESRSEQSSLRKLERTRQSEEGVGAWARLEPPTWWISNGSLLLQR